MRNHQGTTRKKFNESMRYSALPHDHYLNSPAGLLTRFRRRRFHRFYLTVDDIEPRAKASMAECDKVELQRQLLHRLKDQGRRAFRGPLALRLSVRTTGNMPAHSHHIAKNMLDLFSKPLAALPTKRRELLYADDSQIDALSVICHHGAAAPRISVSARSLGGLLEDLEIVERFELEDEGGTHARPGCSDFEWAVSRLADLKRDENAFRGRFSSGAYDALLLCARQEAQEALLGQSRLRPIDLARLYDVRGFGVDASAIWQEAFAASPLWITLSELPQVEGSSSIWKNEIEQKLRAFKSKFEWIIDPLVMPVALAVLIKPPPLSRQNGLHDLDNVLRKYLIPRVLEVLKPISNLGFALDTIGGSRARSSVPPASTRIGVTRYEVWRLPPAEEGARGFVSIAVVGDLTGFGDLLQKVENDVEQWSESL
jgi:hypothetical protein